MERVQRGLSLCCNGARIMLQWCSRSCKVIKEWFESIACILAQERRKSGLSWEGEGITGTACFHRAAQAELLLFHEEILKGRKKLAPLLPSVNLSCALFLCLSLPSPLQQWEGGSVARQHLPTAGRPLIYRSETQRGTCPNLLEG